MNENILLLSGIAWAAQFAKPNFKSPDLGEL